MSDRVIEKLIDFASVVGQAVLVLLIGYVVIRIVIGITKRALIKSNFDLALHTFICNSIKVVLWIMLGVTVLGVLDIPTSTFVTVLGAGGVAIALALKDSLGNIASGIIILVTKSFKKDDFIDITEVSGVVQHIDLLYTTLKTFDNKVVNVPNGKITNNVLINYSSEETRRVDCKFGIGYEDSIDEVREILSNVAAANLEIFIDPEPFFGVSGHGASSVDIDFKVWTKCENYWNVKYYLQENVKKAFDEAGINIPYPQMDVHLKNK